MFFGLLTALVLVEGETWVTYLLAALRRWRERRVRVPPCVWRYTPRLRMRRKDLFTRWVLMAGCSRLSWIFQRDRMTEDYYREEYRENHAGLRVINDVREDAAKMMIFEMKRVSSAEMEFSVDIETVRWGTTVDNEEEQDGLKIPLMKMRFMEVQRE